MSSHFEYVRHYDLALGDEVVTRFTPGETHCTETRTITSVNYITGVAVCGGWGLNVRQDDKGFGYWGGDNHDGILLFNNHPMKNEDFIHDGAFTSFTKIGTSYTFLNGITDATLTLSLSTTNNVTYTPPGASEIGIFSIKAIEERSMFIIGNDSKEFCVSLPMIRIFDDEFMARRFIEACKELTKTRAEKAAKMLELTKGFRSGSYFKLDVDLFKKCTKYSGSDLALCEKSIRKHGTIFKATSEPNIKEMTIRAYFTRLEGDIFDINFPLEALTLTTKEEWEKEERVYAVKILHKRAMEYVEKKIMAQSKKSTMLFSELVHSLRKESDMVKVLGDSKEEKVKALLEMVKEEGEEISRDKRVRRTELNATSLVLKIETKDIFIREVNCIHGKNITNVIDKISPGPILIGKFDIEIDLFKGEVKCVRVSSVPGINGKHPHISDHVCWGNMDGEVAKLLAEMRVNEVVQILFTVLENINIHSTYTNIPDYWDGCPYHNICLEDGDLDRESNKRNVSIGSGEQDEDAGETEEDETEDTPF